MPKGQSPKLEGALCNIPINVVDGCNTLLHPADSNDIIVVKLKINLQTETMFFLICKSKFYFEVIAVF